MKIKIDKLVLGEFMQTLDSVLRTVHGASQSHRDEITRIMAEYENAMINDSDFEIEMSQSFYETWVHKTFEEIFSRRSEISKTKAKKLNRLFESLNDQDYNEEFLRNYNEFTDRD